MSHDDLVSVLWGPIPCFREVQGTYRQPAERRKTLFRQCLGVQGAR
jgi:hypothetical protein